MCSTSAFKLNMLIRQNACMFHITNTNVVEFLMVDMDIVLNLEKLCDPLEYYNHCRFVSFPLGSQRTVVIMSVLYMFQLYECTEEKAIAPDA